MRNIKLLFLVIGVSAFAAVSLGAENPDSVATVLLSAGNMLDMSDVQLEGMELEYEYEATVPRLPKSDMTFHLNKDASMSADMKAAIILGSIITVGTVVSVVLYLYYLDKWISSIPKH